MDVHKILFYRFCSHRCTMGEAAQPAEPIFLTPKLVIGHCGQRRLSRLVVHIKSDFVCRPKCALLVDCTI